MTDLAPDMDDRRNDFGRFRLEREGLRWRIDELGEDGIQRPMHPIAFRFWRWTTAARIASRMNALVQAADFAATGREERAVEFLLEQLRDSGRLSDRPRLAYFNDGTFSFEVDLHDQHILMWRVQEKLREERTLDMQMVPVPRVSGESWLGERSEMPNREVW